MEGDYEKETLLATLDGLQAADEIDIVAWMRIFKRILYLYPSEELAYSITRRYFDEPETTPESCSTFMRWQMRGDSDLKRRVVCRVIKEGLTGV